MSADQVHERRVWRKLSGAWAQTESGRQLADKRWFGKVRTLFSLGFLNAARNDIVRSTAWECAFPKPFPLTPKEQSEIAITSSWMHLHPATISRGALRFSCTYGLGGLAAGLFFILTVTGVLLMFFYVPSVDHAYKDMVDLGNVVSLGQILRNMHRWGANAMVIVVCLHMLRVFLQKAYEAPRQLNWVVGVVLLVLTMLLSFTGYLLPWDQLAYWAITVGTNMAGAIPAVGDKVRYVLLGGFSVDQPTLIRFYVFHVIFLPIAVFVLMAYHFWRVRKDGFSGGLE
jgi:cytochrome b6